jgi:hypothetical protein
MRGALLWVLPEAELIAADVWTTDWDNVNFEHDIPLTAVEGKWHFRREHKYEVKQRGLA